MNISLTSYIYLSGLHVSAPIYLQSILEFLAIFSDILLCGYHRDDGLMQLL